MALALVLALAAALLVVLPASQASAAPCDAPVVSKVACENTKTGSPSSEWAISGAGSSSIQGFATDMSVNVGQTVGFKVDTTATSYRLDIYRMGYYAGLGARKIATVNSATINSDQPNCMNDTSTGLIDCGNWSQTASWAVPVDAVSGIYFAKVVSSQGSSHIFFIVRDDSSTSNLLFQSSDTTWQAYNDYGGNSLYVGSPAGRAYKVSYNRPFNDAATSDHDFVWNAEYPAVRFLEANGYDISYTTGIDSERRGNLIKNHKAFLSVGHDEYWSGSQRANVEAARDAGVNLAFFSGNEVFWKTRWEKAISADATDYRTLVSYKETHANAKIDPLGSTMWTGTWRDPRFSPPADGGRPENNLTGTIFYANCCTTDMIAEGSYSKLRFWRNTRVANLAANATTTLGSGILGYEWDESPDNGFRPAGMVFLSTTTQYASSYLQDYGSTYAPGTGTHHLTLYRAASGALVFGAGSIQWAWGLDNSHTPSSGASMDVAVKQATVNLLADMGAQPTTLQSGLVAAAITTDTTAPTSSISAPAAGSTVNVGQALTVTGTAADAGGQVAGVEVSVDNGASWHPATGTTSWSYTTVPTSSGTLTIRSRATDDSARTESPAAGRTVTVGTGSQPPGTCPCSIWPATAVPAVLADPDNGQIEVGLKFRATQNGSISGIRFYKGAGNTGTHTGSLWISSGTKLATATFAAESASGWQQVNFAAPVAVTANTTYVASYYAPTGHYSVTDNYFSTPVTNGPLSALADGVDGVNGVYKYGATGFPSTGYAASNYWVDVVFSTDTTPPPPDTTPPTVTGKAPADGTTGVSTGSLVTATFSESVQASTVTVGLSGPSGAVTGTQAYVDSSKTVTFTPSAALAAGATYTATVSGAKDAAGNATTAPVTWSFTTATAPPSGCPCSIWPATATPAVASDSDTARVEVGVKFRASQSGKVAGIRFYKGTGNTGTHIGSLWSATGTRLAQATFTGETASGWQQVLFTTPFAVTAGTTYVASYFAPSGRYSVTENYFASAATTNGPLTALRNGTDGGNGLYRYASSSAFPNSSYRSSNYWVDVVFTTS